MPSDIQVHRQVPLNNAKISEETKLALHKLLKKFDPIISKSDNDRTDRPNRNAHCYQARLCPSCSPTIYLGP